MSYVSSCSFGKKCEFQELTNLLHGFLLTGDRSVEAVAVTARVVMKQSADFLGNFVSVINLLTNNYRAHLSSFTMLASPSL